MITKVSYGNKATINTGNYENLNPMYNVSVEFEKEELDVTEIEIQLNLIKEMVDAKLTEDITRIKLPTNLRLTDGLPHVTDIISLGITPKIPHIEEHAKIGTWLDGICKSYIDSGILIYDENIPSTPNISVTCPEIYSLIDKWFKKHVDDVVFSAHSINGVNRTEKYCGELDAFGKFLGKLAIFDFKKTKNISKELKEKYFMQMAAYAHFNEVLHAGDIIYKENATLPHYLVIVSPFNEPIYTEEVEKYYQMFLEKRSEFRRKYGI